eukprot:scaffold25584_cov129-Isochrysis_galbana.AAC.3
MQEWYRVAWIIFRRTNDFICEPNGTYVQQNLLKIWAIYTILEIGPCTGIATATLPLYLGRLGTLREPHTVQHAQASWNTALPTPRPAAAAAATAPVRASCPACPYAAVAAPSHI